MLGLKRNGAAVEPEPVLLEPTPEPTPPTRDELVRSLAVMTDDEFRSVAEEARGPALITLAELAAEGFANSNIQQLAKQLGDELTTDDIGRHCVTRAVAKRLFTERETKWARQREENRARAAELKRQREERQQARLAKTGQSKTNIAPFIPEPDWNPTDVITARAQNALAKHQRPS